MKRLAIAFLLFTTGCTARVPPQDPPGKGYHMAPWDVHTEHEPCRFEGPMARHWDTFDEVDQE